MRISHAIVVWTRCHPHASPKTMLVLVLVLVRQILRVEPNCWALMISLPEMVFLRESYAQRVMTMTVEM